MQFIPIFHDTGDPTDWRGPSTEPSGAALDAYAREFAMTMTVQSMRARLRQGDAALAK